MWCTAFNVSLEQSHTWRLASLFILFAYKIQECLFSAWNNFCSGFKWKYVFTKTRKSTGSSPLHWEAHSDSQQPSTQGLIRDSPGANCLVDSALAESGVVFLEFSWKVQVYATNMLAFWYLTSAGDWCWLTGVGRAGEDFCEVSWPYLVLGSELFLDDRTWIWLLGFNRMCSYTLH